MNYLKASGFNAESFALSEDINSIFSNGALLNFLDKSEEEKAQYVRDAFIRFDDGRIDAKFLEGEIQYTRDLKQKIESADFIIVTLGNIIDALRDQQAEWYPGRDPYPRFFRAFQVRGLPTHVALSKAQKAADADYGFGESNLVEAVISFIIKKLRELSGDAEISITVSPVPIDLGFGIPENEKHGPMIMDTVSKSVLRAGLHSVLEDLNLEGVRYFPSFEIIKWIGSVTPVSAYGAEDGCARHISSDALYSIMRYFEHLYCLQEDIT